MSKKFKNVVAYVLIFVMIYEFSGIPQIAQYVVASAYAQEMVEVLDEDEVKALKDEADTDNPKEEVDEAEVETTSEENLDTKEVDEKPVVSDEDLDTKADDEKSVVSDRNSDEVSDEVLVDGFVFNTKTKTIIGCSDISETVVIPSKFSVEGKDIMVEHIADDAFACVEGKTKIKDLSFEDGCVIETIGKHAFDNNEIQHIEIPASVELIDEYAFANNDFTRTNDHNRLEVVSGSRLGVIAKGAFSNTNLDDVDLTQATSLTKIEKDAFKDSDIFTLKLPSGIKTIGDEAFSLNRIKTVEIPTSVTSYGSDVFVSNGRYVKVVTHNDLVVSQIHPEEFGSVVNPVSIWVKGVDATSNKTIMSAVELSLDEFDIKDNNELLYLGNHIDMQAPFIEKYKPTNTIKADLTKDFLKQNTETNPIVVEYNICIQDPIFKGVDLLEIIVSTPADQVDLLKGVTAFDYSGKDITNKIKYTPSEVDTSVEGRTIINLSVSDEAGNTAEAKREVIVTSDPMEIETGKGWLMKDFTYSNNVVTGLSDTGKEKLKTNKDIVLPSFNPNYTEGKHELITKIDSYAFSDVGLRSVVILDGIKTIGSSAFKNNEIINIYLPDGLESVGEYAFANNSLLQVKCPDSLVDIEANAFRDNNIESLILSDNLKSIEDSAFRNNNIESLVLSGNLKSIKDSAFRNNNIFTLILPDKLESIGDYAFEQNKIVSVSTPDSLKTIGSNAFENNHIIKVSLNKNLQAIKSSAFKHNNIEYVEIPQAVTELGSYAFANNQISGYIYPNNLTSVAEGCFYHNRLESIELGENINNIGSKAFAHNLLKEVEIPTNVENIESEAFTENYILKTIRFNEGLRTIGSSAFRRTNLHMKNLDLPSTLKKIGSYAFCGNDSSVNMQIENIVIPEGVERIESNAFRKVYAKTLKLPSTITAIDSYAFYYNNLRKVDIPEGVTYLGSSSFSENPLSDVKLPSTLTVIDDSAFKDVRTLRHIDLPDGLTDIRDYAFRNAGLVDLEIPNTVTSIGSDAFSNNYIGKVVIPDSVTSLGNSAFSSNQLTSVKLSNSLSQINNSCFANNDIATVVIPEGVKSIKYDAFKDNCINNVDLNGDLNSIGSSAFKNNLLDKIDIPDSVTQISNNAFENNALTSVNLPNGITEINYESFAGNNLEEIVIPDSVKSIGGSAFENNALTSVNLPNGITNINDNSFACNNLEKIAIPDSVKTIGRRAFEGNKLNDVEFSDTSNLNTIESNAFANNDLTEVKLSNSVKSISSSAFVNNHGWNPFNNEPIWPVNNSKVRLLMSDSAGNLVNPNNIEDGESYCVNCGIVKYLQVEKGNKENNIATPTYYKVKLGDSIVIEPEEFTYYIPVSSDPITVRVDEDHQSETVVVEYDRNPDKDPSRIKIDLHHLVGVDEDGNHIYEDGLKTYHNYASNEKGYDMQLDIVISVSGDKLTFKEPWVYLDLNGNVAGGHIVSARVQQSSSDPVAQEVLLEHGVLKVHLKNDVEAGSNVTVTCKLNFDNVYNVPNGYTLDLTQKAYFVNQDNNIIKRSDNPVALRNTGEGYDFDKYIDSSSTYKDYYVKTEEVNGSKYVTRNTDEAPLVKFVYKAKNYRNASEFVIKDEIPTYTGIDENGKVRNDLKAIPVLDMSPGWDWSKDKSHLVLNAEVGLSSISNYSSYDCAVVHPVYFKFPGALVNEEIRNTMETQFISADRDYVLNAVDGKNPEQIFMDSKNNNEQVPYQKEKNNNTRDSVYCTFKPYVVEPHNKPSYHIPSNTSSSASMLKRCIARVGYLTTLWDLTNLDKNNHLSEYSAYFVEEGGQKTNWDWWDDISRNPTYPYHDTSAFFDNDKGRHDEFLWGIEIKLGTFKKADNIVITDTSLDERMRYTAITLPEGLSSGTLYMYSSKESQVNQNLVYSTKIYGSKFELPAEVSQKAKSFKIVCDDTLLSNCYDTVILNNMAVYTKLRNPDVPAYTPGTSPKDDKNKFINKATFTADLYDGDNRKSEKNVSSTEYISPIPTSKGQVEFNKVLETKNDIYAGSDVDFGLHVKTFKVYKPELNKFMAVDILPRGVAPIDVEFSEAFVGKAVNPEFKFVKNINNTDRWGIVITADSYNPTDPKSKDNIYPYEQTDEKIATLKCRVDILTPDGDFINKAWIAYDNENLYEKGDKNESEAPKSIFGDRKQYIYSSATYKILSSQQFVACQYIKPTGEAYENVPWSSRGIDIYANQKFDYRLAFKRTAGAKPTGFDVVQTLPYNNDQRLEKNDHGKLVERGTDLTGKTAEGADYTDSVKLVGPISCMDESINKDFIYKYAVVDTNVYQGDDTDAKKLRDSDIWLTEDKLPKVDGKTDWSVVTSCRIICLNPKKVFKDANKYVQFIVPMQAPDNPQGALDGKDAVTSFSYWNSSSENTNGVESNNVWAHVISKQTDLKVYKKGIDRSKYNSATGMFAEYPLEGAKFKLWKVYNSNLDGDVDVVTKHIGDKEVVVLADPVSPVYTGLQDAHLIDRVTKDPIAPEVSETEVETNKYGFATFERLYTNNDYVLEETYVPNGYIKPSTTCRYIEGSTFKDNEINGKYVLETVINEKEIFPVPIQPIYHGLEFNKVASDGKPLPMVKFKLETVSSTGYKYVQYAQSDRFGLVKFSKIPAFGTEFTLTEISTHGVLNKHNPIKIRFAKNKDESGKLLNENKVVKDNNGNVVAIEAFGSDHMFGSSWGIDDIYNSKAALKVYKLGLYTQKEINKSVSELTTTSGKRLSGVKIKLVRKDGKPLDNTGVTEQILTTDAFGLCEFNNLEVGVDYELSEVEGLQGYKKYDKTIDVSIDRFGGVNINGKPGKNNYIVVPNIPEKLTNTLVIYKSDQPDGLGKPIEGATFELYETGLLGDKLISEKTSDENGTIIFEDFGIESGNLKDGTFKLVEKEPATGYANVSEPYIFKTNSQDYTFVSKNVYNPKITLEILKTKEGSDEGVGGAKFNLYQSFDGTGEVLASVVTDADGKASFDDIDFDVHKQYSLKEVEVPEGFDKEALGRVTRVDLPGEANLHTFTGHVVKQIENKEAKAKIVVHKFDTLSHQVLQDVEFNLYEAGKKEGDTYAKGDLVAKGVTGEDGRCVFSNLESDKYILSETKAPSGFSLAEDRVINVDDAAEYAVSVGNVRKPVNLELTKQTLLDDTGTPINLGGVEFGLTKVIGNIPIPFTTLHSTTNAQGKASFNNLTVGSRYLLTEDTSQASPSDEVGACAGYLEGKWYVDVLDKDITKPTSFRFTPVQQVQGVTAQVSTDNPLSVVIVDSRVKPDLGKIDVVKTFDGGEALTDASFEIELYRVKQGQEKIFNKENKVGEAKPLVSNGTNLVCSFDNLDIDYFNKDTNKFEKYVYFVKENSKNVDYGATFTPVYGQMGINGEFESFDNPQMNCQITNKYNVATCDIKASKTWSEFGPEPSDVSIKLLKSVDGVTFTQHEDLKTLSPDDQYVKWDSCPVTDKSGKAYVYKVEEVNPKSFYEVVTSDAWTADPKVETKQTHEFKITNNYKAHGTVQFKFNKTLNGIAANKSYDGKAFNFELVDADNANANVVATAVADDAGNVVFNADGTCESLQFTQDDIDNSFTYYAREVKGASAGVDYDSGYQKVVIKVIDNKDGTLSFETEYENDSQTFINTYEAAPVTTPIMVHKNLDGRDWLDDEEYTFKIRARAAEGEVVKAVPQDMDEVKINKSSKDFTQSFGLFEYNYDDMKNENGKSSQTKTFGYDITEVKPEDAVGGVKYDTHTSHVSVTVKDNYQTGKLEVVSVVYDNNNDLDAAEFTNQVLPVESSVTDYFAGKKSLDGRPIVDGEFSFKLVDVDTNKTVETVKCDEHGAFKFSPIEFSHTGEFKYQIAEICSQAPGVTYDTRVYDLVAHVGKDSNDSSKLVVTWTAQLNDVEVDSISFDNVYKASGSVVVLARKLLDGVPAYKDAKGNKFEFELVDASDNVIGRANANSEGYIAFNGNGDLDALSFTQDDVNKTYEYRIREVKGTNKYVKYDPSVLNVLITVIDNKDSTLSFKVQYSDGLGYVSDLDDTDVGTRLITLNSLIKSLDSLPTFENTSIKQPGEPTVPTSDNLINEAVLVLFTIVGLGSLVVGRKTKKEI